MIRIDQVKVEVTGKDVDLTKLVAKKLKVAESDIKSLDILKKSVDARKKPVLYFVYSIIVQLSNDNEKKTLSKFK